MLTWAGADVTNFEIWATSIRSLVTIQARDSAT